VPDSFSEADNVVLHKIENGYMNLSILGSGAWEGIPAPFCNCRVCLSALELGSKDFRMRPQLLVKTEEGVFLLEISPDIRMQAATFSLPEISDFVVSHWHFDHMYGLLDLHAWADFVAKKQPRIFCSAKTKEWLDTNFAHIPKEVVVLTPFQSFELAGVRITPIPLYHMRRRDETIPPEELRNTFGYVLEHGGKKVAYLADYYAVPERSLDMLKGSDVVIADGTYLFEEDFPNGPEQDALKTDPDHMHDSAIIDLVSQFGADHIIFHSISHLSGKKHDELFRLLPEGMSVGFDGMQVL